MPNVFCYYYEFRCEMKELTTDEQKWLKAIGKRLREVRKEKGYGSFEFFAWDNKLSSSTYKNMEHGKNVTLITLKRALKALDISIDDFFKGIK